MKKKMTPEQAMDRMEELCKSLGIPSTRNQQPKGMARVYFINKPNKSKNKE